MKTFQIIADEDYVREDGVPFETNDDYLSDVMHDVFESYRRQFPETQSFDEAITAARELRNASMAPDPEPAAD
mgnify:CR=1 FL=1